jgi:integrase
MPDVFQPSISSKISDGHSTALNLSRRLLILTGLRTAPVITAHIDEIDENIWTLPGAKMKGRLGETQDFRVPLSDEALRVIERAKENIKDG